MRKGQGIVRKYEKITIYHQNYPNVEFEEHSHPEAQLFLCIRGDVVITVDGMPITLRKGMMLFIYPNTPHSFKADDLEGERIIVNFNREFPKSIKRYKLLNHSQFLNEFIFYILLNGDDPVFTKGFYKLLETLLEKESIFGDLKVLCGKIQDQRALKALDVLEKKLEITISDTAKEVGVTVRTLNRIFQKEVGVSPKKIQNIFRVEKAKILLRKLSVTEVCYECGHNSLSQFIKVFKDETGVLPSQWSNYDC